VKLVHAGILEFPENLSSCRWCLLGVTSPGSGGGVGEVGETSLGNGPLGCLGKLGVIRRKEEDPQRPSEVCKTQKTILGACLVAQW